MKDVMASSIIAETWISILYIGYKQYTQLSDKLGIIKNHLNNLKTWIYIYIYYRMPKGVVKCVNCDNVEEANERAVTQ